MNSRVYFTDRDLGKQFSTILASAGLNIERHHDLFKPDGSDEQWLQHCGENGRIAITHNERIRYTPNELAAVKQHRVSLRIAIGHTPFPLLATNFLRTLPKIEAFLIQHKAPFIAKVYRPTPAELGRDADAAGRIELWYPK